MTDVLWETSGADDIKPKGNGAESGKNKNIIPNKVGEVPTPDVGTETNPWGKAWLENLDASITGMINSSDSSSGRFTVKGSGEYVPYLIYADAQVNRVKLGTLATIAGPGEARTILCQDDAEAAIPVASGTLSPYRSLGIPPGARVDHRAIVLPSSRAR